MWYEFLGDIDVTEDWQTFEFEHVINSNQAGGYSVAFNCNVLKTEVNNYYFRILDIAANAGDVTDDERTLQKVDIALPVPAPDKEANVKVDMAPLMDVLEVNDLTSFLNENSMCASVKTTEGEGDDMEIVESLMSGLQATTGILLDDMGSVIDSEDGINIYFPEEEISGTEATLNIGNFSGKTFEAGNTVDTKICFEKKSDEDPDIKGWLYGFNITLMDPEAYEKHAGISEVVAMKMGNNAIYDLSGRKVSKPTKGLYIQNGKKVIK